MGQRPYVQGAQCSQCPNTHPGCDNGLCTQTGGGGGGVFGIFQE